MLNDLGALGKNIIEEKHETERKIPRRVVDNLQCHNNVLMSLVFQTCPQMLHQREEDVD